LCSFEGGKSTFVFKYESFSLRLPEALQQARIAIVFASFVGGMRFFFVERVFERSFLKLRQFRHNWSDKPLLFLRD